MLKLHYLTFNVNLCNMYLQYTYIKRTIIANANVTWFIKISSKKNFFFTKNHNLTCKLKKVYNLM